MIFVALFYVYVYIDTLVSKLTKCDSIVTFVLNVKDAIRVEEYRNICYGDSYQLGSQTISASGDYIETFETDKGCDSIVTLHATVLPDYRTTINATIVEGERYTDNGFVGLSEEGTYTLPLKSKVGDCDSTITLNLKVVNSDNVSVDNNLVEELKIFPNPVQKGSVINLSLAKNNNQSENLVIEIFDLMGQLLYSQSHLSNPSIINAPYQSGIYLIRITKANGHIYQHKIIVE